MRFSIIIPTFNEEKFLPILLESLKKQTFSDYEIIVSDNNSPDNTRKIAKRYGCAVVDGNMPGPARNSGAKIAQGDYLVFLDADVTVPKNFLETLERELSEKNYFGATTLVKPLSKKLFDRLFFCFANWGTRILQYIKPVAHGFIMIIKNTAFQKVKGFDERIEIGEDFDLASRIGKIGKFRVISKTFVSVSVRRFEKEGRWNLLWKLLSSTIQILVFRKKITKSHYDWGNHT